jgi:hypothetical protein
MAIKINNIVVIDNDRKFKNITGVSGLYKKLHPLVTASTNQTMDFSQPFQHRVLLTNTSYNNFSNVSPGFSKVLIIDRNGSSLNFTSNVKWAGNVTPDFTEYRFWTIGLLCWADGTVLGSASGMTVPDPIVSELSNPLTYTKFIAAFAFDQEDGSEPGSSFAQFGSLRTGKVRTRTQVNSEPNTDKFSDWFDNPSGLDPADYEITATIISEENPSDVSGIFDTPLNLNSDRFWAVNSPSGQERSVEINFEFREVANPSNKVSRTTRLTANSSVKP